MDNNKKTFFGLLLFLGFPFLLKNLHLDLMLFEAGMWLLLLMIVLWILFVEKRTLASIGWKKLTTRMALGGIGIGILIFIIFGAIMVAIQATNLELNQEVAQAIAGQSTPVLLLIAFRAAVVEEVLYRGFAFERLFELSKSKWLSALIPVILFTLAHLSWGVGHLVFVFIAGGIFMLMYVSKKNLPMLMIAHFVTDIIALLLSPLMLDS